ncbi:MAG TPA: alpha/beta hydrolase [Kribbellaceae bacterium]|jgi:pimeloyl-ACP methyl ester carboxylesterase
MDAGKGAYADINGLNMYYETHGSGDGVPLVLLHGALSATGTSFGGLIPGLSEGRRLISIEQQAHGHTADIDRPLSVQQMAEDTTALLAHLGVEQADFFGYSMGAGIALTLAVQHVPVVRKLVFATVSYNSDGLHPGLMDTVSQVTPEMLAGTPWEAEYQQVAPRPEDWATLVRKNSAMESTVPQYTAEQIKAIEAPMLIILGDSDIVTPEHGVEMFRLVGGGVIGDLVGLPKSQLAILPGTAHSNLTTKTEMLLAMIPPFLDAPV